MREDLHKYAYLLMERAMGTIFVHVSISVTRKSKM